ncbi:hypothetical protein DMX78_06965 [Cutibacterium acnes]|uniref:Uncharacterized protein n=1 Tax=Cutibacterium acnes TaxID=1747 RepID=A0A2B7I7H0_CUTAC|nr:hypothetical protein CPA42_08235 [Cutibacterium acnes]OQY15122.1 MAG: hypothetical protein B6I33_01245 [Propionibacterium sp. 4572_24]PGF25117.1 hypothetical protein B1B06_10600 [Cutibacterium acnes subsp. acnes]QAZ49068.1 hypothetical protein cact_08265 [Cutibacterium acnes DSM 1897]QAZ51430.1 hypothetical protein cbac_08300 [Cutibacterium acnes KPA171202]RHW00398.1 hypothetical protein DXA85_10035 [Propionibacterium sp. KPL2009]
MIAAMVGRHAEVAGVKGKVSLIASWCRKLIAQSGSFRTDFACIDVTDDRTSTVLPRQADER